MAHILAGAIRPTTWSQSEIESLTVKELKLLSTLTVGSYKELPASVATLVQNHYKVTNMMNAALKVTTNDRQFFAQMHMMKASGGTDIVSQIHEKAWAAQGDVKYTEAGMTVEVGQTVTNYVDAVIPILPAARKGIAQIANALACVAFVEKGKIQRIPEGKAWSDVYGTKQSPVDLVHLNGFVQNCAHEWDNCDKLGTDKETTKTYRGLLAVSVFIRFFSVVSIEVYLGLHTYWLHHVMRVFKVVANKPTDEPKQMNTKDKGIVPVLDPRSFSIIAPDATTAPGKFAQTIYNTDGYCPKLWLGPVVCDPAWVDIAPEVDIPVQIACVAHGMAASLRGGSDSYWSKTLACSGLSIASDSVNRLRMLASFAKGVYDQRKDKALILIEAKMNDLPVLDATLVSFGYRKDQVMYRIEQSVLRVTHRSPFADRLTSQMDDSRVYIAVYDDKPGNVTKRGNYVEEYDEATRKMLSMLPPQYIVYGLVMSGLCFAQTEKVSRSVVKVKTAYDFRAILTSDPRWVLESHWPKKKVLKSSAEFYREVFYDNKASVRQMTQPGVIRSSSIALLNILKFDHQNSRMVLSTDGDGWVAAPWDAREGDVEGEVDGNVEGGNAEGADEQDDDEEEKAPKPPEEGKGEAPPADSGLSVWQKMAAAGYATESNESLV